MEALEAENRMLQDLVGKHVVKQMITVLNLIRQSKNMPD